MYRALYRVWRPQRFDDLVGQQMITQTLKNAIMTHQTSHAYLFTGPRGTGKTSAAKIFAKAINCHHLVDGEPCNECETCKAITTGQLNDVIEIDAASNNGVEEIRDIRDKAKYAPTEADYKIYIIDEVHMLSTGAFNALLKTLEEPPANVIFILATTEPHKIPLTIISRTQRFDFRRITAKDSYGRMVYILDQKKVTYDEKALRVIAQAAEGGMRDALSILDQVISFGDNTVTLEDALMVTGSVTKKLLADYLEEVTQHVTKPALETMRQILQEGKDANRFIEDLISYTRDVLFYQQAPEMVDNVAMGENDQRFADFAKGIDPEVLYQMIKTLNDVQQQMRFTTHPDVYLEVLTVKLSQLEAPAGGQKAGTADVAADSAAVQQLTSKVDQLQSELQALKANGVKAAATKPARVKSSNNGPVVKKVNVSQVYPILGAATKDDLVQVREVWSDLMNILSITQRALMHVAKPVAASDEGVVVAFDYPFLYQKAIDDQALMDALGNGLDRLMGHSPKLVCVPKEQWPQIRKDYLATHQPEMSEAASQAPEKPAVVDQAQQLFGDLVEVKSD
ncbi:DNA polymerase III subunit gamma/tau [Lactiplantibacillus mudanjiangensis]|uniref:DNA-directed DNA polymerase n=1 Tax=Lactiplantibacillus mudanjiangensis TaxID=1296538 RepID=A0A660DXG7_9LACO|nr:DNA polymerase III subunit gamma/tau [Lactiplantibacillus mudanjiangensis]VDG24850.1 DNA polymerase III subunit gamma/tau [Lactobacillus sp.] [Lactiplantibacillus mudanjiangensis]VDG28402.1 DNA polymerase III subunit gamma/tau [Lactobacillus sp.] [Lactiplantibacillus mudanjiangensis]